MDANEWPFPQLMAFAYALPRLLAMFSVIPMLSRQTLPGLLRIGVAAALAVVIVPLLQDEVVLHDRTADVIITIVVKEAAIGFAIGAIVAIPFWAFESMGALVDMQRGASMAEALNPLTGHEASPLGQMFSQASVTFLFATGGFVMLLAAVYRSYAVWPVFNWWPHFQDTAPQILLGQLDQLMHMAVLWSAPVICIMFLAETGLALVSRFAPQLQVFFLAMPIKSGLAIFVFAVYAGTLFDYAHDEVQQAGTHAIATLNRFLK